MKKNESNCPQINKENVTKWWGHVVNMFKSLSDITILRFVAATKLLVDIEVEMVKDTKYLITTYPKVIKDILEFGIEKINEIISFAFSRVMSDNSLIADLLRLKEKYETLLDEYDSQIKRTADTIIDNLENE